MTNGMFMLLFNSPFAEEVIDDQHQNATNLKEIWLLLNYFLKTKTTKTSTVRSSSGNNRASMCIKKLLNLNCLKAARSKRYIFL